MQYKEGNKTDKNEQVHDPRRRIAPIRKNSKLEQHIHNQSLDRGKNPATENGQE